MEELILNFKVKLEASNIIQKLRKDLNLIIAFHIENWQDRIVFKHGEYVGDDTIPVSTNIVTITGYKEGLLELLEGKELLRKLIKDQVIHVNASIREILLLESIFFLTPLVNQKITKSN